jgi:hypothetical protein
MPSAPTSTYVWVQQRDEGALEQLVAVKGKVVGDPGKAGSCQAGPKVLEGVDRQEVLRVLVTVMLGNVLEVVRLVSPHLQHIKQAQG